MQTVVGPNTGTSERLERIIQIVAAIKQYQYVPESGLQIEAMLGAARLAAKNLLQQKEVASQELREQLERFSTVRAEQRLFLRT